MVKKNKAKDGKNARQRRAEQKRNERLTNRKPLLSSAHTALSPADPLCSFLSIPPRPHPFHTLMWPLLTSAAVPHILATETALDSRQKHQFNRWVNEKLKTGEIRGYENEIRWGYKTGHTHEMCNEAQWAMDRFESERAVALDRLNRAKTAVNPGAKPDVWVDDWSVFFSSRLEIMLTWKFCSGSAAQL